MYTNASFQVVITMSTIPKGYKIPHKSDRVAYYRSQSIEIFDHPVVEKVSFKVYFNACMHVRRNAAE